ncbi:hypothetical protein [Sphingomonas sp.]|uniref:hypothetical protein n=1 Tax=Sphingomonas sp. TaxID=28214 RepID=UPI0031DD9F55
MDRPLSPNRTRRFHAARFAHAVLLCLILYLLASGAVHRAVTVTGETKTMLVVPVLVSVSAQLCPETDSVAHLDAARPLVTSLACSLLNERV